MSECSVCGKRGTLFAQLRKGLCGQCYADKLRQNAVERLGEEEQALQASRAADPVRSVILTTESAHNLDVTDRHGVVTAEVVIGMHVFRDIASSFRDVFGGRSETMQRGLKDARIAALEELQLEAAMLGANAIVGIDLDYSDISGGGKNMLLLVASGTAVTVQVPLATASTE